MKNKKKAAIVVSLNNYNGAHVKARDRIPEDFIHELLTDVGQATEEKTPIEWLWRGRRVKLVDGSTVTMADTPENQAIYGQISSQKEGVGFPITRMMAGVKWTFEPESA